MKQRIIVMLIMCLTTILSYAQNDIEKNILDYYATVPYEKIFLHTDKDYYVAGDTIWFRGHMVDAASGNVVSRSKFMYIELLDNSNSERVERVKIKADKNGCFSGRLLLGTKTHVGKYTLCAYTQWMRNFSDSLLSYKEIHIIDDKGLLREAPVARTGKLHITATPEGGTLIAGQPQRIAYRVTDQRGNGVSCAVRLVNDKGDVLQHSTSSASGIGAVITNSRVGDALFLEAITDGGDTVRHTLPKAEESGITLAVRQNNDFVTIQLIASAGYDKSDLTIVLYGMGNLLTIPAPKESPIIRIEKSSLKSGVVNIALVDKRKKVLSERMCYVESPQKADVEMSVE